MGRVVLLLLGSAGPLCCVVLCGGIWCRMRAWWLKGFVVVYVYMLVMKWLFSNR